MKKLIFVLAAFTLIVGAYAQTDSTNRKMNPADITNPNDGLHQNRMDKNQNHKMQNNPVDKSQPDGVMMQNGKMVMLKNGKTTNLDHDLTLSNGTKIMSDGTYIKKDGTKMKIKEGQYMDMSGNIIPMNTNKDKNMYLVPDNTRKKDN